VGADTIGNRMSPGAQTTIADGPGGASNLNEVFMQNPSPASRELAECLIGLDIAMLAARHVFVGALARLGDIRAGAARAPSHRRETQRDAAHWVR
jgi:hypothetical protein